jgi:hypothetical protein
MTFADLLDHVRMYAGRSPHSLVQTASDEQLARFINVKRKEWAERARCFYEEASAFETKASKPVYDLRTDFGHSFIEIVQVTIDSQVLTDFSGKPGPVTQNQLYQCARQHQTESAQKPSRWSFHFPRGIRLWPTPADAYDDCYAAGYTYPPELTGAEDDVLLHDFDFDNHAKWIAGHTINPRRDREDAASRDWLLSEGEAYLEHRAAEYVRLATRGMAQGVSRPSGVRLG